MGRGLKLLYWLPVLGIFAFGTMFVFEPQFSYLAGVLLCFGTIVLFYVFHLFIGIFKLRK